MIIKKKQLNKQKTGTKSNKKRFLYSKKEYYIKKYHLASKKKSKKQNKHNSKDIQKKLLLFNFNPKYKHIIMTILNFTLLAKYL